MGRLLSETRRGVRLGKGRVWGHTVRYAEYGSEDAENVVLMFNGIGANIETAESFITSFTKVRAIIFDAPGVGGTATPLLPYRLSYVAGIANKLLEELGVASAHVFGVSWGGAAAQQFANDYRGKTRSLTLAATSAGWMSLPGSLKALSKMLTPRRHTDPKFMEAHAETLYGGSIALNEELLREFSEALDHGSMRGYLYQLGAISGWTSWLYLPRLTMPALVLMGEDDRIVPTANGRILASRMPNARLEIIDCGHLFIVTRPQQIAERVERFIEEIADA